MVLQLLVSGAAMGFVYCLVAIEYSLIWNSCMLLNFAHTQLIVLGAYIFGGTLVLGLGLSYALGIAGTLALVVILGVILAFIIFIPLKDVGRLYAIIATLMVGTMITELCNYLWGVFPMSLPGYLSGIVRFGSLIVTRVYLVIMVVAVIVIAALVSFMKLTKTGKAMRCVSENKAMAAMVGINVPINMMITITISTVICAVVGVLIIPLFGISTNMATTVATKGFIAAVFGGFGSIPGAILGGILLGIIENVATIYIDSVYKDVVSFIVLIVVILIKPSGLLGASKAKLSGRSRAFLAKARLNRG